MFFTSQPRQFRHFPILQELRVVICDCIGHRAHHVAGISPHGQARVLGKSLKWCYPLMCGETTKTTKWGWGQINNTIIYTNYHQTIKSFLVEWGNSNRPDKSTCPKTLSLVKDTKSCSFSAWQWSNQHLLTLAVIVVLKGIPKITSNCQFHPRCFPCNHHQTTRQPHLLGAMFQGLPATFGAMLRGALPFQQVKGLRRCQSRRKPWFGQIPF